MVTDSFPPVFFLSSPPLSAPIASDSSNMHSCSLTGRAFEINLLLHSRGAIGSLNTTGTVQPLCVLCLLQPNQESIVFEVLVTKTPAVLVEVKGLTPTVSDEHIISQSMSEPMTMQPDILSSDA